MTQGHGWVVYMVTFMARLAALAGVIAVGALGGALVCAPAQAQTVEAFGYTTAYRATLELFDGTGSLVATVSTSSPLGVFQGFVSNSDSVTPGYGGPRSGGNTSYSAGSYLGMLLVDYFGFNMARVPDVTITSAQLVVYSGAITNDLTYTLLSVTPQSLADLQSGDQNAALYENLVKGVSYASFEVGYNTTKPLAKLYIDLTSNSGTAVADINTAIQNKAVFAVTGVVSAPVPEPSTWVMLLAGFAGLGVVARRRAAKRRAAAG